PFYQEMLKILAKRGIIKTGNMTPRELAEHALEELGGSYRNVLEITKSYEMVRYGGMTLSRKEREEINMVLEGLRKAK
ncbi:MAG: DUF4129 domain-containing protein, partial [Deltaproteobacteria bacterium]